MIYLLIGIIIIGYIIANHQNILIELKILWKKIK